MPFKQGDSLSIFTIKKSYNVPPQTFLVYFKSDKKRRNSPTYLYEKNEPMCMLWSDVKRRRSFFVLHSKIVNGVIVFTIVGYNILHDGV